MSDLPDAFDALVTVMLTRDVQGAQVILDRIPTANRELALHAARKLAGLILITARHLDPPILPATLWAEHLLSQQAERPV